MKPTASESHALPPVAGETARALSLPTLTGEVVSLADARGQPVLVSFLRHAG